MDFTSLRIASLYILFTLFNEYNCLTVLQIRKYLCLSIVYLKVLGPGEYGNV